MAKKKPEKPAETEAERKARIMEMIRTAEKVSLIRLPPTD